MGWAACERPSEAGPVVRPAPAVCHAVVDGGGIPMHPTKGCSAVEASPCDWAVQHTMVLREARKPQAFGRTQCPATASAVRNAFETVSQRVHDFPVAA
jgi:hypothetical protein